MSVITTDGRRHLGDDLQIELLETRPAFKSIFPEAAAVFFFFHSSESRVVLTASIISI